jgi:hypothetical protein
MRKKTWTGAGAGMSGRYARLFDLQAAGYR